ncbi:MAG TPA: thioredoxin domain-containing protein [Candidatus Acidoferrales bacterium]|nr:thioredoxin domain-containing protein [Candidatus Acidoferrales bacterium]
MRCTYVYLLLAIFTVVLCARAQSTHSGSAQTNESVLTHSAEAFIRNLFTWGPEYKVEVGPLGASPSPEFYSVPFAVTYKGQTQRATYYISKNGKEFIRGEMFDTSANPFASNLAKLHVNGDPSRGPADAPVTIVEFADFECPHCREVHTAMESVEKDYPQLRLVFKDFPLTEIHPWAESASIGAHCAFEQSSPAFWKMYNLIFDHQDTITPDNVFDQMTGFATQIGLNASSFKACMASPEAKQAVEANHAEGVALHVDSTPTLFINGRPLAGGDRQTIEAYIKFALAHRSTVNP